MTPSQPVYLRAVRTWLPDHRDTVADAVATGLLDPADAASSGYTAIAVEPEPGGPAAPEMAVQAARDCLAAAQADPADVGLLLHAWTEYQGHDLWSPPHYIADQIGARNALPIGVRQLSNGSAAAMELAVPWLAAHPGQAALITTGDRFRLPGFDRWNSDRGLFHADGATAALLCATPSASDALILRGLASSSAAHLEGMHRGSDPFSVGRYDQGRPIDLRRTKRAYFATHGKDTFVTAAGEHAGIVVRRASAAAGVALDDPRLRLILLPRVGRRSVELYAPVFAELTPAKLVDLGEHTGHLGAGDLLANMTALTEDALLDPGDLALVFNGGGGYTWTCALVQVPDTGSGARS